MNRIEEEIGLLLKEKKMSLSTAESCTGGGVAAAITSVPGSSAYFNGGIVAYSNEVKMSLLGVSPQTLENGEQLAGKQSLKWLMAR